MDQGINGRTVSGVLQAHTGFKFVKEGFNMDSRKSGNDGEGCRNDGEGAGNDGLVLWSPYPKLGLMGIISPSLYGKGWSAQMAGHSRTLSTALPQRRTRPCSLTPASPYGHHKKSGKAL